MALANDCSSTILVNSKRGKVCCKSATIILSQGFGPFYMSLRALISLGPSNNTKFCGEYLLTFLATDPSKFYPFDMNI